MKSITIFDLQYEKEKYYFQKIGKQLNASKGVMDYIDQFRQEKDKDFYNLLSTAIKIDRHPEIRKVIESISILVGIFSDIHVFLYQNALPDARCYTQKKEGSDKKELIVLVSQHFFNDLTTKEKMAIIGHELAHMLYGHTEYPKNFIMEGTHPKEVKSDVNKWSICCEISCDVLGYVAADRDAASFNSAMIKFTTGIKSDKLELINPKFIKMVLAQYDEINASVYTSMLSSHPITPLRVKLVEEIAKTRLVKNYGRPLNESAEPMIAEYNQTIDKVLKDVYPQLFPVEEDQKEIMLNLCLAVTLSDGKVDEKELSFLKRELNLPESTASLMATIKRSVQENKGYIHLVQQLLDKSVALTIAKNLDGTQIIGLIKKCLAVAKADGKVVDSEIDCIAYYGAKFGIDRLVIIVLLGQMGL